MGYCIGSHGGADVVALAVDDDEHALFLGIGNGFSQCLHALPAEPLIESALGLDGGNHITDGIDNTLVEAENGFSSAFQGLAVLGIGLCLEFFGDIFQLGVQTHYGGVLGFHDLSDQSVK